ncbi:MFS transporter [Actinoplanes oblitus]|uniref:MFS transporter n=1 Tax=Actinoplanes oblitus TaxID=3040509 RepID=A0ABY8W973_9ACTN|nr:MFS transporter [Actinoplanes oblitus]WIM94406.1 MFS transporter [Actinoplanes oblitus]
MSESTKRWGLLRHHDFRQLIVAESISHLGSQITILALPLVAVAVLHAPPFQVALLMTFQYLAFLVVGLPAGALVDRMRRRRVLVAADLGRAVLLGSIPLAWALDWLSMPQLYVVVLLSGVLTVFFDVAYQSYLPHLVREEDLVEGNAKLEAVQNVAMIGGPAVGGLLVRLVGAPIAVLLDALSFLGSALFVGRIRSVEQAAPRPERTRIGQEIMQGLRFVLANPVLRAIALSTAWLNFFSAILESMILLLLARTLGLSAGVIGLLLSLIGLGALAGALSARRVTDRFGQRRMIWVSIVVTAPFGLLLPFAREGWLLWAAMIGWAVTYFGGTVYNIAQVSLRQALTPPNLLGRMNATMRFMVWGTLPLGSLVGGVLGQYLGVRPAMLVGAIGYLFGFVPVVLSPLRRTAPAPVGEVADDLPGSEQPVRK